MKLSGAQIILKKLIQHKVDKVFEFPGGSICPILDELYKYHKIKRIVTKHEQAAIHAADSYARLRRDVSVCMATSGPGASNLVTGIANAYMDSVPIVIITGQVAVWDLKGDRAVRQRGFQELDIVSLVKTITKKAYLVNNLSDLGEILDKAFLIAKEGRPGPVLVDVPINIQYTISEYKDKEILSNYTRPYVSAEIIDQIAKKIIKAKRPLVIAGAGIIQAKAEKQLFRLLHSHKLPAAETLLGLTAVPSSYALNLGLVGYAGSKASYQVVKNADFILGLGIRFDNRAFPNANREFSKDAYIVHVDCDKHELNHRVLVNKAVLSDVGLFIDKLLPRLRNYKASCEWIEEVRSRIDDLRTKDKVKAINLCPRHILGKLSDLIVKKDFIITTDVGQHQLWAAQHIRFNQSNSLITSGGLGTMGFGLPAAIGAQLAKPDALVINITSDGSFQMNIQELATLKDYRLPVKILLFNNKCLGLVRQIQEYAFSKRYESTIVNKNLDFTSIASAYGIRSRCIKKQQDLDAGLKEFINSDSSMLLEVEIEESKNVYPVRIKGNIIYE